MVTAKANKVVLLLLSFVLPTPWLGELCVRESEAVCEAQIPTFWVREAFVVKYCCFRSCCITLTTLEVGGAG